MGIPEDNGKIDWKSRGSTGRKIGILNMGCIILFYFYFFVWKFPFIVNELKYIGNPVLSGVCMEPHL